MIECRDLCYHSTVVGHWNLRGGGFGSRALCGILFVHFENMKVVGQHLTAEQVWML